MNKHLSSVTLSIFFLCTLSFGVIAQESSQPDSIESEWFAIYQDSLANPLCKMANDALDIGNRDQAKEYFKQAGDKGYDEAFILLASLHEKDGNLELVEKYYKAAADRGNKYALYLLGRFYLDHNRLHLGLKHIEDAAEKECDAALLLTVRFSMEMGHICSKEEQPMRAQYHYKRAEKYFNLLLAKEKRENRQLTKKQFCSQLCFLGLIYQFQNKNELAEPTFIKARNLGSGEAASMLATMYFSQGKNDLAEEHIKIASELMAAQERE